MAGIFDRIAGASGADETELTVEPIALDDGMDDEQPLMSAAVQVDERRTPQRVRNASSTSRTRSAWMKAG